MMKPPRLSRGPVLGLVLLTAACEGGDGSPTDPWSPAIEAASAPAEVQTLDRVEILRLAGAVVHGTVDPNGSSAIGQFKWGSDPSLDGASRTREVAVGAA